MPAQDEDSVVIGPHRLQCTGTVRRIEKNTMPGRNQTHIIMEDGALIERLRMLRKAVDAIERDVRPGMHVLAPLLDAAFTSDERVCDLVALLTGLQRHIGGKGTTTARRSGDLHSIRLELDRLLALGSIP